MTKITVIVPLYYGKKYLNKILSMIQHNYECVYNLAELELILVNDSPEENVSMVDVKGCYGFKIQIISNEQNKGIHYSRVQGLKEAKGEFVTFLDQDDVIADNFFESQLKHIRDREDIIVANGIAEYATHSKLLYRCAFMQWTIKCIWFYAKFGCRIISPGQCLIRRSSIPEVWVNRIMTKNGADDYFLWLLMLTQESKFGVNREILYTHKYTSVNASDNTDEMKASVLEVLKLSEDVLGKKYYRMIKKNVIQKENKTMYIVKLIERINRQ